MNDNVIYVYGDDPVFAVDDDPMFQEILEFAYRLSDLPNDFIRLKSGYECLETLLRLADTGMNMPALIMMDINMPGLSGIETVAKIREDDRFTKIPIITMLSSSNENRDVQRSLDAGANDYREKPFDITQMKFIPRRRE